MRPLDRWFLARLRETTFRYLPEDARILEIGAGTGRNFVYYPTKTLSIASEPSREMLKIASEKKRPNSVRLVQSCAEQFFDLLNLVTVPLFDDHFNRRTAEEAQANGLQLVKVERSLLGIINLISCRV